MNAKSERSFASAADLVLHAEAAADYIKVVCAACADGDKLAARRSLRRAVSELEIARAQLRMGLE
jgi:hypothetical protein